MDNSLIFSENDSVRVLVEHAVRYRKAVPCVKGLDVLDIGCAARGGSALLAGAARSAVAIDVVEAHVAWVQEHYPRENLKYLTADVLDLPFSPGTFDAVTCFDVIEHVADYRRALDNIARVVKDGGLLVLTTPNAERRGKDKDAVVNDRHVHEFTAPELREVLAGKGFEITEFTGFSWAPGVDRPADRLYRFLTAIDVFKVRRLLGRRLKDGMDPLIRRAAGAKNENDLKESDYVEEKDPAKSDYFWLVCRKHAASDRRKA